MEYTEKSHYKNDVKVALAEAIEIYLRNEGTTESDTVTIGFNCRKDKEQEDDFEYECVISNFSDLMSEADVWSTQKLTDKIEAWDVVNFYEENQTSIVIY